MPAARIVPAFDEVEDGKARLYLGAEPLAIEQLALEGREEALAQGVVVRVADAAHRRPDASLATPLAERDRRVLAALVGVMNDVLRLALYHGHVQRRKDELSTEMGLHRPADDPPTPGVDHDGEKQEPGPGRDVCDVGDPQPVRARGRELPIDEIRRPAGRLILHRRAELFPTAHAVQAGP